jgi:GNAT superfamily N-acetyltransferase
MKNMNIEISADLDKLKIKDIQSMLSKVWWSPGITADEIQKGIRNSALVVGAYLNNQSQVGFLRVISDKVRFAYIMDVVIEESMRRKGLGQAMVQFALAHPELKDVYQWLLRSRDAPGVYEKCGFQKLQNPEWWMSMIKSRPDRKNFKG